MKCHWFILIISAYTNAVCGKTVSEILFTKHLKIDRILGRCPGYDNLVMYFQDIRYNSLPNHEININTKVVATRDLLPDLKLVLKLERCKAKEDLDSCEPYQDVNRNDLCELHKAKHQPWTPFIHQFDPELPCPLKKGVYISRNTTFDSTPLMALPIRGWYWKIKSLIYEKASSKLVMCMFISGHLQ